MAGRIATQEELLALMMELQNEMPDAPTPTYSPEELAEFAKQSADDHREYMYDNVWMLGLPAMGRQVATVGGAVSDGIQRVRNSSNVAKDFLWPRRLRNLDPYTNTAEMTGHMGLTSTVSGNHNQQVRDFFSRVFGPIGEDIQSAFEFVFPNRNQ